MARAPKKYECILCFLYALMYPIPLAPFGEAYAGAQFRRRTITPMTHRVCFAQFFRYADVIIEAKKKVRCAGVSIPRRKAMRLSYANINLDEPQTLSPCSLPWVTYNDLIRGLPCNLQSKLIHHVWGHQISFEQRMPRFSGSTWISRGALLGSGGCRCSMFSQS